MAFSCNYFLAPTLVKCPRFWKVGALLTLTNFTLNSNHVVAIQNVQRRAIKELPGMANLTYIERLNKLKLPS